MRLRAPQKDGHTYRDHLEAAVRIGKKSPADLEGPEIPEQVAYLWGWFMELDMVRTYTELGPQPVSYREIAAWADLTQRDLLPVEVDALVTLDVVTRSVMAENRRSANG